VKRVNKTKDEEKEDKMKSQRMIACKHCKNNLHKMTRNKKSGK
jgi:predicted metal-binding protein